MGFKIRKHRIIPMMARPSEMYTRGQLAAFSRHSKTGQNYKKKIDSLKKSLKGKRGPEREKIKSQIEKTLNKQENALSKWLANQWKKGQKPASKSNTSKSSKNTKSSNNSQKRAYKKRGYSKEEKNAMHYMSAFYIK